MRVPRAVPRRAITPARGVFKQLLRPTVGAPPADGSEVRELERVVAARVGVAGGVAACSGRLALLEILDALALEPGAEVIFPAYTMESLPALVRERGWKPVFVDADPESFQMSPAGVLARLGHRTGAVIATHLFGTACDVEAIGLACAERGIPVIEDCAHALGAHLGGRPLGSFGRAAFFSFEIAKHVNTYGGSVVTTDDTALLEALRRRVGHAPAERRPNGRLLLKMATTWAEQLLSHPVPYGLLVSRGLSTESGGSGLIDT